MRTFDPPDTAARPARAGVLPRWYTQWRGYLGLAAAWVLGAIGFAIAAATLLYACFLAWVLVLSLALFLAGPDMSVTGSPTLLVLLVAPPLAIIFLVARYLARQNWTGEWMPLLVNVSGIVRPYDFIGPRITALALAVACIGFLAFARLVFLYARIQGAIDEGIYLYAARLAMSGLVPYRDFYFDQAPLLPYAFGLALGPFAYDEVAARLFAILCTLLTLLASFFAAMRLGGRLAGLVAFGLLVTCVDFTSELSGGIQSNGGLTALVVALVALALAYERLTIALLLACMAAGLRQLFIPLPLLLACYAAVARGRPFLGVFAGVAPVVVVYVFFLVIGGPAAPLALLRPLREPYVVRSPAPGDIVYQLHAFQELVVREMTAYFPFLLLAGPAAYVALRRGHPRAPILLVLAASCAVLFTADLLPAERNPRYPVTLLPLAAVLGAVSVVSLLEQVRRDARRALATGLALLLAIFPTIAYRDANFVSEFQNHPPLARFLAAAEYLRSHTPPSGTLVTLETPFASQTGLRLARGLEAGSWGVYGNITPQRAEELGVVTYPMLADMVEQGVGDTIIESDRYGFVNNYANNDEQKRRIENALRTRYELKETFGNVSDWGNVRVWVKRY